MKKQLRNQWALVTGSSRGIGQQIALGLADLGCNVIVHGRSEQNIEASLKLLADRGVEVAGIAAELDSAEGVDSLVAQVNEVTGQLDILYNNAAINCEPTPLFDFDMAVWQKVMQVNVFAMVQLCNAFGPAMKSRQQGRIVNVSSGICDQPHLSPYSVSKAAVDKFTQDLAFEFKDTGVRVNCIDPGWIRTDLGGPNAWEAVESVLPGMLAPVLVDDNATNGEYFHAQRYKYFE